MRKIVWLRSNYLLLENERSRTAVEEQRTGEAWIVLPAVRLISFGAHEGISMSSGVFRNATWEFDPSRVFWKL